MLFGSFGATIEQREPTFLDAAGFSGQQFRRLVRSHFVEGSRPQSTRRDRETSKGTERGGARRVSLEIADRFIDRSILLITERSTVITAATPPPLSAATSAATAAAAVSEASSATAALE